MNYLHREIGTRLQRLPLDAIRYSGRRAEKPLVFDLAADAKLIGWGNRRVRPAVGLVDVTGARTRPG